MGRPDRHLAPYLALGPAVQLLEADHRHRDHQLRVRIILLGLVPDQLVDPCTDMYPHWGHSTATRPFGRYWTGDVMNMQAKNVKKGGFSDVPFIPKHPVQDALLGGAGQKTQL